ncbi:MAG: hypothetical protein ABJA74_11515 [Lapillicoccus sp.]
MTLPPRPRWFAAVRPTPAEVAAPLPGDDVVPDADVVMDRGFSVEAPAEDVWPWLVQLGKQRAGWYLPRSVERFVPRGRRATHTIENRWQTLKPGVVIPDYGGRDETFEAVTVDPPHALVYRSRRGRMNISWAIVLTAPEPGATRVRLRLRLAPVRRRWLATTAGEAMDVLTIAGMAAGLRERLVSTSSSPPH